MSWFRDIVDIIITRNPYFCHWQLTSQHPRCWKSFVMSLHSTDTDLHRHWCNQLKDLGWTSIIGFRSFFLIEPKQRPFYAISVVKYSNRQLFVSKGRLTIYFVSSWDRVFIVSFIILVLNEQESKIWLVKFSHFESCRPMKPCQKEKPAWQNLLMKSQSKWHKIESFFQMKSISKV